MTNDSYSLASLPFVAFHPDGSPRNLWSVQATGDWRADCTTGREHAGALIAHMAAQENPTPFAHIVAAMPRDQTGIEVGFLTEIAARAR